MKLKHLLIAAFAAMGVSSSWAQKDITSTYITNATLSTLEGWTNTNFNQPQKGTNTVGYASECYAGWGALETSNYSLKQDITLPAGRYRLVNYSFYRSGAAYNTDTQTSNCNLIAGEKSVPIKTLGSISGTYYANSQVEGANAFDTKMYRNVVEFDIDADNTAITIGLDGTHKQAKDWIIAGMFELFDLDQEPSYEVPTDMTYAITNPGFEYRNATGWTCVDFGTHGLGPAEYSGTTMAEKWANGVALGSGKSIKQTITDLPNGVYDVKVRAQNIEQYNGDAAGTGMFLVAGNNRTEIKGQAEYTVRASTSNGQLTIGIELENCTGNWVSCDNFKLLYCGVDLDEYKTTLTNLRTTADGILTGGKKFNASAKSELQSAYDNTASVTETRQWLEDAMASVQNAINAANTSIAIYDPITAKYESLDTDGKAAFATTTTGAKYMDGILVDEDVTADYIMAVKAQGNGSDMTVLINNPSFENNATGWTDYSYDNKFGFQTNAAFGKTGNKYCEFYQPGTMKGIKQTLSGLKAGHYQINAHAMARGIVYAYLFADGITEMTIEDNEKDYTVDFYTNGSDVTFGIEGSGVGNASSWLAFDNFRLTYVDNQYPTLTGFANIAMQSTKLEAQTEAITAYNADKTAEKYAAAIAAINEARTSATLYGQIAKVNKQAETLDNAGRTAYASTLEAYNNRTLSDIATVNNAYLDAVKAQTTPNSDFTPLVNNPGINGDTGWTCERPKNGNGPILNNNSFEYWGGNADSRDEAQFDYWQTITNLPNGYYTISAEMYNSLNGEEGAEFNESCGVYGSSNNGNVIAYVTADGTTLTQYTTDEILVTDGTLRIGVKSDKRMGARWFVADNFKLTLAAPAVSATMTVNSTAKYGTFCAPFAVEVPSGVTASTAEINGNGVTIDLTEVENGIIPANTPVILYGEKLAEDYSNTFYGKAVAGTPTNGCLTGVYASTPAIKDTYVLQNNEGKVGFYQVETAGITNVGANRCYLTAPAQSLARVRALYFGDKATAINAEAAADDAVEAIYNANGTEVSALQPGLNIVKMKSGKVQKVLVK